HLHDSFSLHRRGTLEDAKNWKTGSAAHDSTLLLATRIPSARVQPRLSFGRGTTHWCSTGPRSYSVSGSNAPLLKRPLCRCGSIVRPFHPCWSAPTAPVDDWVRNDLSGRLSGSNSPAGLLRARVELLQRFGRTRVALERHVEPGARAARTIGDPQRARTIEVLSRPDQPREDEQ